MTDSVIPLARPIVTDEMVAAASAALRNEFLVMGESVHRFEEEFAAFCGVKEAVSVNNGTMALQIALGAAGIGPGDSVLTTPMTFIATANAIHYTGARPVFADIDPRTKLLDPGDDKISTPKAVVPVHLYGTPSATDAWKDEHPETLVVEDACQAHGAWFGNKRAGALGDVGCFSFYTTKNMTVGGDGGMITTNDVDLAEVIRSIRDCGRQSKYFHNRFGHTARLNTANAAFGRVQLRHLDHWNELRLAIAQRYDKEFMDLEWLERPEVPANSTSVHHLYTVGTSDVSGLQSYLSEQGIQTGNHYPVPVHLQPPYRDGYGYTEGDYPVAERWARRTVSLPIHPMMGADEIERVVRAVQKYRPKISEIAS